MDPKRLMLLFIVIILGLGMIVFSANMVTQIIGGTTPVHSTVWVDIKGEIVDDGEIEPSIVNCYVAVNATYPLAHNAVEADLFDENLMVAQAPYEGYNVIRGAVWFDIEGENASFSYARIRLTVRGGGREINASDTVAQHHPWNVYPSVPAALGDYDYQLYYVPYDARVAPTILENATVYLNLNAVGLIYVKSVINGTFLDGLDSYWAKWILRCANDYSNVPPYTEDIIIYYDSYTVQEEPYPTEFAPTLQLGYDTITYVPNTGGATNALLYLIPIIFAVLIIAYASREITEEFKQ